MIKDFECSTVCTQHLVLDSSNYLYNIAVHISKCFVFVFFNKHVCFLRYCTSLSCFISNDHLLYFAKVKKRPMSDVVPAYSPAA